MYFADDLHHWVCTTSVNTVNESDVHVMDSLSGMCPMSPSLQRQIAQVYGKAGISQLTVNNVSVQQQVGVMDCGLFAVAFAIEISKGYDPSRASFNQKKMRSHLAACFEKGRLVSFHKLSKSQEVVPRPKSRSVIRIPVTVASTKSAPTSRSRPAKVQFV